MKLNHDSLFSLVCFEHLFDHVGEFDEEFRRKHDDLLVHRYRVPGHRKHAVQVPLPVELKR